MHNKPSLSVPPQHATTLSKPERVASSTALAGAARSTFKPISAHFGAVLAKARGQ